MAREVTVVGVDSFSLRDIPSQVQHLERGVVSEVLREKMGAKVADTELPQL